MAHLSPNCTIARKACAGWECCLCPVELRDAIRRAFAPGFVINYEQAASPGEYDIMLVDADLASFRVTFYGKVGPSGSWDRILEAHAEPLHDPPRKPPA